MAMKKSYVGYGTDVKSGKKITKKAASTVKKSVAKSKATDKWKAAAKYQRARFDDARRGMENPANYMLKLRLAAKKRDEATAKRGPSKAKKK